ncbi:MAG: DNA repair protein RadC [Candidatus Coatesbacteria bacterium]|nr:DNA repair protein RadC [Candidatus Coatesbacteria bacterium]
MSTKPHYYGHRSRLRDKFLKLGAESLSDYEIVELLLGYALPRRDVKPLAKELIALFSGFASLFDTKTEKLIEEGKLSENTALIFALTREIQRRYALDKIEQKPAVQSPEEVYNFARPTLAGLEKEEFWIAFLDAANRVIAFEKIGQGTVNQSVVYPRIVVERCIKFNTTAVIFMHNHPAENLQPSVADITLTQKLKKLLADIGIFLHDHVIIGKDGFYSFRREGRL